MIFKGKGKLKFLLNYKIIILDYFIVILIVLYYFCFVIFLIDIIKSMYIIKLWSVVMFCF